MQHLVVAYPRLSDEDDAWVRAIRERHDPHAALIAPHFTLVFPAVIDDPAALSAHVRRCVAPLGPFPFVARCAIPVKDALSPSTHVFLVPDEGLSHVVRLHDALYGTFLAPSRRLDIPFIPHITVGAAGEPEAAAALADAINRERRVVRGQIDHISIISFDGKAVALREQIALR